MNKIDNKETYYMKYPLKYSMTTKDGVTGTSYSEYHNWIVNVRKWTYEYKVEMIDHGFIGINSATGRHLHMYFKFNNEKDKIAFILKWGEGF